MIRAVEREKIRQLRWENAELKQVNESMNAASVFSARRSTVSGRAEQVVDHLRGRGLGVDPVCPVLRLSPSTYFAAAGAREHRRVAAGRSFGASVDQPTDPGGTTPVLRPFSSTRRP